MTNPIKNAVENFNIGDCIARKSDGQQGQFKGYTGKGVLVLWFTGVSGKEEIVKPSAITKI